jgi:hypothetical protein
VLDSSLVRSVAADGLFAGVDWGNAHHQLCLVDPEGRPDMVPHQTGPGFLPGPVRDRRVSCGCHWRGSGQPRQARLKVIAAGVMWPRCTDVALAE